MFEPVPVRIRRRGQPEVTRQIDHAQPGLQEQWRQRRAGPVGKRAERDVGRLRDVGNDQLPQELAAAVELGQVRVDLAEHLPHGSVRTQVRHVGGRMILQEPDELAPGEPGGPEHGYANGREIAHDG